MAAQTVGNVLLGFVDLGLAYWIWHEIRDLTNFKQLRTNVGVMLPLDPREWSLGILTPSQTLGLPSFLSLGTPISSLSAPRVPTLPQVPELVVTKQQYSGAGQVCFLGSDGTIASGDWHYKPSCTDLFPSVITGWTVTKKSDPNAYFWFPGPYGGGIVRVI